MHKTNNDSQPRLLITRFAPHADRLSILLNEVGVFSIAQPLLKVVKTDEFDCADEVLNNGYDYIIAVSVNAVDYTDRAILSKWPTARYIAVGKATQVSLEKASQQRVLAPQEYFNSEGVLDLVELQNVKGKRILILRGKGGREFLADSLIERGATVDYYQPYQRVVVENIDYNLIKKCQQKKINGAIITSIELINQLVCLCDDVDQGWLKNITIYSASQRIADHAQTLGFHKTKVLSGISDQNIISYFQS